jgi:DNA polymerase
LTYSGIDQTTRQWVDDIRTWGGKLVENAVQATARDVLTDAALRIDKSGDGDLVLSVHDELIWEVPASLAAARAADILVGVEKSPAFAPDLPIGAEGGVKASYGV